MATSGEGAGDPTPQAFPMAEVLAQLASQNDFMVQMSGRLEEFRGRLEVGDADRLRLQQHVVRGERLRQQDVGRMQELRDQAAAATASAAAGRGHKASLVMQGHHAIFAYQLDVLVAGMKRAIRAVQSERITERGNVVEMEFLEVVSEHLKGDIQFGIDKMLELQVLVRAVDARGDDNSSVSSSQGEAPNSGDRTTAARSEQPQVYGVPTDSSVGMPQTGASKEKTRMLMHSKSISELSFLGPVEAERHFMSWVTKVKNFVESEFGEDFRGALQWAAEQDGVISELDINKSYGENAVHLDDRIEDIMNKNRQLYSLLCCTTGQQGVAESPFHHVTCVPWNNGFEAWRMLHVQFYPWRPHGEYKCFDSSSQAQEEDGKGSRPRVHTLTVLGAPSESVSSERPISSDDGVTCRPHGSSSSLCQPRYDV
jgi:hypothetical protein